MIILEMSLLSPHVPDEAPHLKRHAVYRIQAT